jgi:AcrR family transcriptional regulator
VPVPRGQQQTAGEAPGNTRQVGRPRLTEQQKASVRREIARQAVRLFRAKGVAATSADEIAAAVGISVRSLWRHFPNKERCVLPLLSEPLGVTARALREWPPGTGIAELYEVMQRGATEAIAADRMGADIPALLELVRLTRTEPGLRLVWIQSVDDAEPVIAAALAQRAGLPGPDLATWVHAAAINGALRAAMEHYARTTDPAAADPDALRRCVRDALIEAARGFD